MSGRNSFINIWIAAFYVVYDVILVQHDFIMDT